MKPYVIAVSGGIGSGKSVVCRVLTSLGYDVYDTDKRAKELMDESAEIRRRIASEISPDAIDKQGAIDRKILSRIVFSDADKLAKLNQIVHGMVLEDLSKWKDRHNGICFVETALLYQSGLDKYVDEVWEVEAPYELKVQRVMQRNGMERVDVEARIASQHFDSAHPHPKISAILNDGEHSILLQINALLK